MKILVCISHVPDTTTKVKFIENNTKIDPAGVQWVINPWDELALTRALELKDRSNTGIQSVTVLNVGSSGSEPTIRKALAMGADDAIRINAEPTDSYFVASQIAQAVRVNAFDLILCGIESSDFNGSNVGGMLAEFLDCPSVSAVSALDIENGELRIVRDIDGGKEIVHCALPLVAIVQKGIAKEPRIAAMRGIMMARSKTIKIIEPVAALNLTKVIQYEQPNPRTACKFIDAENPAQLISLLQNEAKVI